MSANLVNNKFRITRRIGGGSFGEIYLGIGPSGEKVAVKFERHGTRCPQLRHEYKVYREMQNSHGFCNVYYFGVQDNYNVMVMDLLGPSLEDLFNKCGRKFSLKTVLQIADQMLERVDTLHARHLIHRDIKPANFVVGIGEQGNAVFCVDFGLSKRYRHPKTLQHIPHRDGRSLTGTPRYASINNHLGVEQSRRDDLESIGYVLVYFIKGTLPWQGLKAKNPQKKYRMILEKKQQVSIAQLCQGIPSQFAEFLAYTRSLKFDAKPDIPYLRKLFRDLYHAQGCASIPKLWDWDPIDADYLTNVPGQSGGPPIEGSAGGAGAGGGVPGGGSGAGYGGADARPNTTMAVGTHMGDTTELGGTTKMDGGFKGASERPTTAGGASRGTNANSSWGYPASSAAPYGSNDGYSNSRGGAGTGVGAGGGIAAAGGQGDGGGGDPSRRPHTAGNRPAAEGDGNEGDAVVAGARAMMRYRRTRANTTEVAAGIGSSIGKSWVGGDNGAPQGQQQMQQPVQGQQQFNNASNFARQQQPQQGYRPPGAPQAGKPTAQVAGATGGWGGGGGTNDNTNSRPKSAGLFGSSAGAAGRGNGGAQAVQNRYGSNPGMGGGQVQQQVSSQQNNGGGALSYGALKNRFLSGGQPTTQTQPSPANSAPNMGAGASGKAPGGSAGGSAGKSTSAKLFSLGSR